MEEKFEILHPKKFVSLEDNFRNVYLEDDFREMLFEKAIKETGSMYRLGRSLGYICDSPNWSIKLMKKGKQAIKMYRVKKLSEITGIPLREILKHEKQ